MNNICSK